MGAVEEDESSESKMCNDGRPYFHVLASRFGELCTRLRQGAAPVYRRFPSIPASVMWCTPRQGSELPSIHNTPDAELTGWQIRPNVSQQALYNLLECVMEIAQAVKGLVGTWQQGTTTTSKISSPLMVSTARRISTSVRKILLDGNGSLLKQCVVEPNIHPLSHGRPTLCRDPINFVRHSEEQRFTLGWADGMSNNITVACVRPYHDSTSTVWRSAYDWNEVWTVQPL